MTYSGPVQGGGPPTERPRVAQRTAQAARAGISFGSALAIAISWSLHKSILWAIVHGILSWLYVGWFVLTR